MDGPGAAHMLAAAAGLTQRYPEVGQLFEWDEEDRVVIGVYNPDAREPDACNAMASMCWEVHLLTKSVHPDVKLLAQYLVSTFTKLENHQQLDTIKPVNTYMPIKCC